VPFGMGPRREGDPAILVADSSRLQRELGWVPQHSDIDTIIETGWRWETGRTSPIQVESESVRSEGLDSLIPAH